MHILIVIIVKLFNWVVLSLDLAFLFWNLHHFLFAFSHKLKWLQWKCLISMLKNLAFSHLFWNRRIAIWIILLRFPLLFELLANKCAIRILSKIILWRVYYAIWAIFSEIISIFHVLCLLKDLGFKFHFLIYLRKRKGT